MVNCKYPPGAVTEQTWCQKLELKSWSGSLRSRYECLSGDKHTYTSGIQDVKKAELVKWVAANIVFVYSEEG